MSATRKSLPEQAELWWQGMPEGRYALVLQWRGDVKCRFGTLQKKPLLMRYEALDFEGFPAAKGKKQGSEAEKPAVEGEKPAGDAKNKVMDERTLGMLWGTTLTRAGFQMPVLDPQMLERLIDLRANPNSRLEFMLDTNAMVEGIGHWLARLFADRCDLVTTAVTLREIQDQQSMAQFAKALSEIGQGDKKRITDVLSARQVYLASTRFREFPESKRILWRELGMDDAALLLSRGGKDGSKSSESDTAILRNIRRAIQDRVHGLERFLVTGDTAFGRRATTELPEGSVIAARVHPLRQGAVYAPTSWWPGEDQGRTMPTSSAVRLFWELLCTADSLNLKSLDDEGQEDGGEWVLSAFCEEMWPSDYQHPWILVNEKTPRPQMKAAQTPQPLGTEKPENETAESMPQSQDDEPASRTPERISEAPALSALSSFDTSPAKTIEPKLLNLDTRLFSPSPWPDIPDDDRNYRFGWKIFMDALFALVERMQGEVFSWPLSILEADESARRYLWRMLDTLQLVEQADGEPIPKEGPMLRTLGDTWMRGDWNALGSLLLPYQAFRELIDRAATGGKKKRPDVTLEFGQALASHLGQGMRLDGQWYPGGENPSLADIRTAIVRRFEHKDYQGEAYPILDLCLEVFLKQLGVTPARAIERWQFMEESGVFKDIEFRRGGSSSGKHQQSVVTLFPSGWELRSIDYESIHGYRDLKNRGARP